MIRTTAAYTFFFRPQCLFSQWYPCAFEVEGQTYVCAEQFMMHGKAVLFGDTAVAREILDETSPRQHKALGRRVAGYDEQQWRAHREAVVYRGNMAKFSQNPELRDALLATAPTLLVEASPYDRIWGVGLAMSNPAIDEPSGWRGKNLLGKILTQVRNDLAAAR